MSVTPAKKRASTAPDSAARPQSAADEIAGLALLAAGAARDLVGPLTYVLANLEHLDRQIAAHEAELPLGRTQEMRHCLSEAMLGAERVRNIVRDLPRPTPAEPRHSYVDLRHVLLSCIKIVRTEIDHRARVITEFDAVPGVIGNETRLSRVFQNLLVNAAQAVAGDPEKEHFIRVVMRNDADRRVVVEIADSGPGILPEHMSRLFEPFFTTKPAHQGSGLGLAICRQIVDELGGLISVVSSPGRGATFRVTLPARAELTIEREAPNSETHFTPSEPPVRRLPLRQLG